MANSRATILEHCTYSLQIFTVRAPHIQDGEVDYSQRGNSADLHACTSMPLATQGYSSPLHKALRLFIFGSMINPSQIWALYELLYFL